MRTHACIHIRHDAEVVRGKQYNTTDGPMDTTITIKIITIVTITIIIIIVIIIIQ
jgi:hypothetical protein